MPSGGIAEFAEGFAGSFGRAQEKRRLRDALDLDERRFQAQQEQANRAFNLDVLQFENQLEQQERQFGMDEQRLNFEEQRIDLTRKAEENQERARKNQEAIQNRQLDMQALGMLEQLERLPKKLRKTYLTQLAPRIGVDPKSEEFKTVLEGIVSLDDEELKSVTGQLKAIFPELPPGQAAAFSLGVVSGRMTLPEAMTAIADIQQRKLRAGASSGSGGVSVPDFDPKSIEGVGEEGAEGEEVTPEGPTLANPAQLRSKADEFLKRATALTEAGDDAGATRFEAQARELRQMAVDLEEFSPEAVEQRKTAEITGERKAKMAQPVPNRVLNVLGMDGARNINLGDFEDLGGFSDIAGATDLPKLSQKKAANKQLMKRMSDLQSVVHGREELLGVTGAGVRFMDMVRSQYKGITGLYNLVVHGKKDAFANSGVIKRWAEESGLIAELAGESAVVRSKIIELSFDMAKANDEGRLSDQDYQRSLEQIGASGSVEQLKATLVDLSERFRQDTIAEIEAATGMKPFDMMTPDELQDFRNNTDDVRLLEAIKRIAKKNAIISGRGSR